MKSSSHRVIQQNTELHKGLFKRVSRETCEAKQSWTLSQCTKKGSVGTSTATYLSLNS